MGHFDAVHVARGRVAECDRARVAAVAGDPSVVFLHERWQQSSSLSRAIWVCLGWGAVFVYCVCDRWSPCDTGARKRRVQRECDGERARPRPLSVGVCGDWRRSGSACDCRNGGRMDPAWAPYGLNPHHEHRLERVRRTGFGLPAAQPRSRCSLSPGMSLEDSSADAETASPEPGLARGAWGRPWVRRPIVAGGPPSEARAADPPATLAAPKDVPSARSREHRSSAREPMPWW